MAQESLMTSLPAELQCLLFDAIDQPNDLLALSSTCSYYRNVLRSKVFETVHLRNSAKNSKSVLALSNGPSREHVREIRYAGDLPDDAQDAPEPSPPVEASLSDVLSHLARFPNLHTLRVDFIFDIDERINEHDDECLGLQTEEEYYCTAEDDASWKRLLAISYDAIAANEPNAFRSLELAGFLPVGVNAFDSSAFHDLLAQLEKFSLSWRDWDNGACWEMAALPAFQSAAAKVDGWFFDHLSSVREFSLVASETGVLGDDDHMNHAAALPLEPDHMPNLTAVDLTYLFIRPDLIDFLVAHSTTLESITLVNCFCLPLDGSVSDNTPAWYDLFDRLLEADFKRLNAFELSESEVVLWSQYGDKWPEEDDDESRELRGKLGQGYRKFGYAYLDDKYGTLEQDCYENRASLLEGTDQARYDALMESVKAKSGR